MTDAEKVTLLRDALTRITRRMGVFSCDPLIHASNTIDSMAAIAEEALAATGNGEARIVEVDA